jgi:hypothetical protein
MRGADMIGPADDRQARPVTAREITDALIAQKVPQTARKQAIDIQALSLPHCGSGMAGRWLERAVRRGGDWQATS